MTVREKVRIGGQSLEVSNLDKLMYPGCGFTKASVIDYYVKVAPFLLPHLEDRPVTLKRYPDGVDGGFFYEKQCPAHRPDWVKTVRIQNRVEGRTIRYCLLDKVESLVWAANLADLELHPSLSKARKMDEPTAVVFDLDPGQGVGLVECGRVGLWLREALARLGLDCFVKTSGSKGMQVYLPLNTPVTYAETKPFARTLAEILEKVHPDRVISRMARKLRRNRVFIDWSQNDQHKTTVGVYSLRARDRPTVSTPLRWDEIENAVERSRDEDLVFEADEVVERVTREGDLFQPVSRLKQTLPNIG